MAECSSQRMSVEAYSTPSGEAPQYFLSVDGRTWLGCAMGIRIRTNVNCSNNIGQIAYLQSEKHNLEHIYFGGSFIRGHRQTINTLSYAINFWSHGEKQAYFLRHEGYLGAFGAFLKRQPRNWGRRNSFEET